MATKQAVSKTQAVRDYLNAHPGAGIREIVAALDKQGIKITLGHVATIKAVMCETDDETDDTADTDETAANTAAPPIVEKPATDTLTPEQIKIVAQAIKRIRSRLP